MTKEQRDRLMSPGEAALRLGMTRDAVVRAVQRRELRGEFVDGRTYVARSEVEARSTVVGDG